MSFIEFPTNKHILNVGFMKAVTEQMDYIRWTYEDNMLLYSTRKLTYTFII